MSEKPPIGALVESDDGERGIVVGYEQGGTTSRMVYGATGAVINHFHAELDIIEEDPDSETVWKAAYKKGENSGKAAADGAWAAKVGSAAADGYVTNTGLIRLFNILGEDRATMIADSIEE